MPYYGIPNSGGVNLVGHGYQGPDHYGLNDVTIRAVPQSRVHATPLPASELAKGQTRFNSFHFDGSIYGAYPSRVTAFRCVKAPRGPPLTIRWDDGTGRTMQCQPGGTAFFSGEQLYGLLPDDEKDLVDNSYWEPGPHPFAWMGTRRLRSSGMGLAPGGETVPLEDLPEWSPDKVYKFPMVWVNPVTGAKALQIFPDIIRKLYIKTTVPLASEKVVENLEEIRVWVNDIYDRIATPEYIIVPECEEGDLILWNNWVSLEQRYQGAFYFHFAIRGGPGDGQMLTCRREFNIAPSNILIVMAADRVRLCPLSSLSVLGPLARKLIRTTCSASMSYCFEYDACRSC